MRDRLVGVLLFLPVPIVLCLLTQLPLGVFYSVGIALPLMISHRFYARPWALGRGRRRCLWCGSAAVEGPLVVIEEPGALTTWRCCGGHHGLYLRGTLERAWKLRAWLKGAIFTGLALVVFIPLAAACGVAGPLRAADGVAAFRLLVALAVLPLAGLRFRSGRLTDRPVPAPFPVHIQALIGTWAVLWLFRLVGLIWLALALLHVAKRSGIV